MPLRIGAEHPSREAVGPVEAGTHRAATDHARRLKSINSSCDRRSRPSAKCGLPRPGEAEHVDVQTP